MGSGVLKGMDDRQTVKHTRSIPWQLDPSLVGELYPDPHAHVGAAVVYTEHIEWDPQVEVHVATKRVHGRKRA